MDALGRKLVEFQTEDLLVFSINVWKGYPFLVCDVSLRSSIYDVCCEDLFVEPTISGGFIIGLWGFVVEDSLIPINDGVSHVGYVTNTEVLSPLLSLISDEKSVLVYGVAFYKALKKAFRYVISIGSRLKPMGLDLTTYVVWRREIVADRVDIVIGPFGKIQKEFTSALHDLEKLFAAKGDTPTEWVLFHRCADVFFLIYDSISVDAWLVFDSMLQWVFAVLRLCAVEYDNIKVYEDAPLELWVSLEFSCCCERAWFSLFEVEGDQSCCCVFPFNARGTLMVCVDHQMFERVFESFGIAIVALTKISNAGNIRSSIEEGVISLDGGLVNISWFGSTSEGVDDYRLFNGNYQTDMTFGQGENGVSHYGERILYVYYLGHRLVVSTTVNGCDQLAAMEVFEEEIVFIVWLRLSKTLIVDWCLMYHMSAHGHLLFFSTVDKETKGLDDGTQDGCSIEYRSAVLRVECWVHIALGRVDLVKEIGTEGWVGTQCIGLDDGQSSAVQQVWLRRLDLFGRSVVRVEAMTTKVQCVARKSSAYGINDWNMLLLVWMAARRWGLKVLMQFRQSLFGLLGWEPGGCTYLI